MKKKKHMKMTMGERAFVATNNVLLVLIFAVTLYPMLYVISASVSNPTAVSSGKMVLFPIEPTLESYELIFKYKDVWIGYANTIFYTIAGTLLQLAFTLPAAYALSRKDMKGRSFIMGLFIVTMYFGGGLIPSYLNMNDLGLVNNRTGILLMGLVNTYNLIVARTFFSNTIPWELQEAAYLDGCNTFRVFRRIILPLSSPIIVVLALYYGVGHWNEYFNAMIYLKDRSLFPLQVFLKEILTQSQFSEDALMSGGYTAEQIAEMKAMGEMADRMKYAIIVVSSAPMLLIYPKLQKYFAKGIMIGSVKG